MSKSFVVAGVGLVVVAVLVACSPKPEEEPTATSTESGLQGPCTYSDRWGSCINADPDSTHWSFPAGACEMHNASGVLCQPLGGPLAAGEPEAACGANVSSAAGDQASFQLDLFFCKVTIGQTTQRAYSYTTKKCEACTLVVCSDVKISQKICSVAEHGVSHLFCSGTPSVNTSNTIVKPKCHDASNRCDGCTDGGADAAVVQDDTQSSHE